MCGVAKKIVFLCLLSSLLLGSSGLLSASHANQLEARQRLQSETNSILFSYRWQDSQQRQHQLQFEIPQSLLNETTIPTRQLSPQRLQRDLVRPLSKYAQAEGWHQMQVSYQQSDNRVRFNANIRDRAEARQRIQSMQAQHRRLQDELLAQYFLRELTIPPNQRGYAPDHARIAQASMPFAAPIARAFYDYLGGASPREYIHVIGSFIQSIPYSELTDRLDTGGAGFNWPQEVLLNNRGDCDSKATLMVAILRHLMPNLRISMLYIPKHALLGFAITPSDDEMTVTSNDTELLIFEPTGPALLRLGQPAQASRLYLENNLFSERRFED